MSDDFEAPDYEPSAREIQDFIQSWAGVGEGHGSVRLVPGLVRCLPFVEGVEFSDGHVMADGTVELLWRVPG